MTLKTDIKYMANDFAIDALDHTNWNIANEVRIDRYWSGKLAPAAVT